MILGMCDITRYYLCIDMYRLIFVIDGLHNLIDQAQRSIPMYNLSGSYLHAGIRRIWDENDVPLHGLQLKHTTYCTIIQAQSHAHFVLR